MPGYGIKRTKELYSVVLAAIREHGPQFGKVGKLVGMHRTTVAGLYERGWPDREGCIPIKAQLEMDQMIVRAARAGADPAAAAQAVGEHVLTTALGQAREQATSTADLLAKAAKNAQELEARAAAALEEAKAKLQEVEELARAKVDEAEKAAQATVARADIEAKQKLAKLLQDAKVDAAETLADEANMAKFARKAAMSAVAIAALVLQDARTLAMQLKKSMGDLSVNIVNDPLKATRVMFGLTRLVESAEKAAILALQVERLRVGEPTETLGISFDEKSSLDEKEVKARAVMKAIEKRKAKFGVVNGGLSNAAVGAGAAGTERAGSAEQGVAGGKPS